MFRKESINQDLNQGYTHLCKQNVKPTQWLFHDDLSKTIRAENGRGDEAQKVCSQI